ncbi:cytochrome c maturation protein CcmE [Thalassospira mesophila]|uniref:cytochrome c maturation protein CcmE n=1 Tax=Thalassospira mesophila TaxID=1293891 RepID=UPI000A200B5C|nr:cytochrome c maturation protein CcmE [Thalassospira mesophila]
MSLSRAKSRKRQRLYLIGAALLAAAGAAALGLTAFRDSVVFFFSPTELAEQSPMDTGRRLRIGGLVEEGSLQKLDNGSTVTFTVTDLQHDVQVSYTGILPDLFREGQGVVAEGHMNPKGQFVAQEVLAKHDENYMPREVADALKKSGHWEEIEKKNAKNMRN